MKQYYFGFLTILLLSLMLVACQKTGDNQENGSEENDQISVVTSFYPIYEFTKQVAGDQADVTLMVSAGEDAHHYEPSARDVARANEADVFVYSSELMEHWVDSLLSTIENDDLIIARTIDGLEMDHHEHEHDPDNEEPDQGHDQNSAEGAQSIEIIGLAGHYHTGDVVTLFAELAEEVDYDHWHWYTRTSYDQEWEVVSDQETDHFEYTTTGESFEVKVALFDDDHNIYAESELVSVLIDDHDSQDPHIWLDPVLAQEQVNIIRDALIEADPDGTEIYQENAKAFNQELQTLHEEFEEALIDAENRVFVVQHEAFGHLANRYNLDQVAIGGISTEVEPSPSRIAEIGDLVEEYNVPIIYYQQGANSAIAETVANETGTETAILYDLEVLSQELEDKDLGYIGAMRENLRNLQLSIQ